MRFMCHPAKCLTIAFLALLTISTSLFASSGLTAQYNFTNITMKDGLLHNFIDDIYKDSQGFLWLSTSNGLSRYDGYEFTHYNIRTSPVTLKSNFISKVCEDNFNRLWIASEGGVDVLDMVTKKLVRFESDNKQFKVISQQPTSSIFKDSKGNVWLSSNKILYCIQFTAEGEIDNISPLVQPKEKSSSNIIAIAELNQVIWIGYNTHVYKLKKHGNAFVIEPISAKLNLHAKSQVHCFLRVNNEMWIGTNRGLLRYNFIKNELNEYHYDPKLETSISQSYITDLAMTKDNRLIIATLGGLNFYNPISDNFDRVYKTDDKKENSINCNFINCMLVDADIIWLGTEIGGLNRMTKRKVVIHNYTYARENINSLSKNPVNSIFEDDKANLWVGTVEGGLNKKAKGSNNFIHYTFNSDNANTLSHNSVSAIAQDNKNRLWVGTWGGGVNVMNLSGTVTFKRHKVEYTPELQSDFIGTICYDPINNGMWLGTSLGLNFYDLRKEEFLPIILDTDGTEIKSFIGLLIDKQAKMWVGTSQGLIVIDLLSFSKNHKNFEYTYYKNKLDNPNSPLIEKINCIHESKNGTIWLGSNGYGLYRLVSRESGTYKFACIDTEKGLSNNTIMGILEDNNQNLWLSTNYGISCFNPKTSIFKNYYEQDGLISNQFYWNAYCRSRSDGNLYFGSLDGLVGIEPNKQQKDVLAHKVVLTKLKVLNEEVLPLQNGTSYLKEDISRTNCLHLHERDKSFSLEFSALNYENPTKIKYAYRLLGFDDKWVEAGVNRRFASYTNLRPGTYIFQVKYSIEEGVWANNVTELKIVVEPFFYKTWWFISLFLLLLLYATYRFYKFRISQLKNQRVLLESLVEERTLELEGQKKILEIQTVELSNKNETLVLQNEKITRQKSQIIMMSKKVQESTVDKLAFFTNITHELRTPITLITGPIERALKLSDNAQVNEQLNYVARNSKYLLSLVNQLMDFRKVDSGNVEIVLKRANILQFLENVLIPFEAFAKERGIVIKKYVHLLTPNILFDEDGLRKIATNLLSNAIKFTPDNGVIHLYFAGLKDELTGRGNLYFCVKDSGFGILEDDLVKIFDRFYQSKQNMKFPVYGQSGTGIGLYLCRRIVQMHGGVIYAKNGKTGGAAFRVLIPYAMDKKPLVHSVNSEMKASLETETVMIEETVLEKNRLTILVVDDNRDMLGYIYSILQEQYNVLTAENGQLGLDVLKTNAVDFIITDLMMPIMDGIEFSKRIKENFSTSHIPILILTAKTSNDKKIESFKLGVDEYLTKPFDEELLMARIGNILKSRKISQTKFTFNMDVAELNIDDESRDKKFLDKAVRIVKNNYKDNSYEVSDFIDDMGVSKSLLNKKLQMIAGQSAGKFIRTYRLTVAHELILKNKETRNMNVSEIAEEVGFNDPKYFTRCFTKHYGIAPSSMLEK